jgi:hypothetical protein
VVILELLEAAVGFAFDQFGVGGVSVGAVALLLAAIWYGREAADLLLGAARWLKIGSVLLGGLGIAVVAALATGALSVDSGVLGQLLELLGSVAEGL